MGKSWVEYGRCKMETAEPTDLCTCDHMLKSHKNTNRWNSKKGEMDCRIKCRYCKCNLLLRKCIEFD